MKSLNILLLLFWSISFECFAQDLRQMYESTAVLKQQRLKYCMSLKKTFNYYGAATTASATGDRSSNGMSWATNHAKIDSAQNIHVYIESNGNPNSSSDWNNCKSIIIGRLGQNLLVNSYYFPGMKYRMQFLLEGNQLCRYTQMADSGGVEIPSGSKEVTKICSKLSTAYNDLLDNSFY